MYGKPNLGCSDVGHGFDQIVSICAEAKGLTITKLLVIEKQFFLINFATFCSRTKVSKKCQSKYA